ncbi:MAG: outer membrane beta-barrel protein [Ignavibacteriaceae bacterium]|nr:outer membrane beta-barrel protein [Ignavibacteriaceae bacterium]
MKKATLFLIIIILFLSTGVSFSQIYVKLGGGYNVDFNSMNIGTNIIISNSGVYNYEAVTGSFGKGPSILGTLGYNFSSYLAGELGLIYKLPVEFEETLQAVSSYTAKNTITGSFFGFSPSIVISAPLDNVKPFIKLGLLVALPATEYELNDSEGNTTKGVFGGSVDFGLTGAAGILVPISTQISINAEIDFVSFTWKPDEVEVTDIDGTKEVIKLEHEWTSNDGNRAGPSFIPFSNLGFSAGIQLGF